MASHVDPDAGDRQTRENPREREVHQDPDLTVSDLPSIRANAHLLPTEDLSTWRYDISDVQTFRNAMKLSTKFYRHLKDEPAKWSSVSAAAAEAAILIASYRYPRETVTAAFLHDAFANFRGDDREHREKSVARKFGDGARVLLEDLTLLEEGGPGAEREPERFTDNDHAIAIWCALQCAQPLVLTPGEAAHLDWIYQYHQVAPGLLDLWRTAHGLPDRVRSGNEQLMSEGGRALYSQGDIQAVCASLKFGANLFAEKLRKWGSEEERLPLSWHATEVGMMLLLRRRPAAVVMAGMLHDIYEDYVTDDVRDIERSLRKKLSRCDLDPVLELIRRLSEPPKSSHPGNFNERKEKVLHEVLAGDASLASLFAAAKISTISAGIKWLVTNHSIAGWSAGSIQQNCELFRRYVDVCRLRGAEPGLLSLLEEHAAAFARHGERVQREAARVHV